MYHGKEIALRVFFASLTASVAVSLTDIVRAGGDSAAAVSTRVSFATPTPDDNDRSWSQCERKMRGTGPFGLVATGNVVNGYYGEPKPGDLGFIRRVVLPGGYGVGSPDKYAFIDGFTTVEGADGSHQYFCSGKVPQAREGYKGWKVSTPPAPGSH